MLNGASSSGKSTLAAALLVGFSQPWTLMAIDDFHGRRARKQMMSDAEFEPVFQRTVLGFHRAVAGVAAGGNDVVVDHVLGEEWRLRDIADVLATYPAYLVGVHCDVDELERRELARGTRQIGRAAFQLPLVHAHKVYDIEVDTTRAEAAVVAAAVISHIENRPPTAFAAVRRST